jgi:hypothetical protein
MKIQSAFFEDHAIRRFYDETTEIWWFSVIDIIQVLTRQPDYQTARKYWNKLKERLGKEGSQLVTNCHQLKMTAQDGKQHSQPVTNCTDWNYLLQDQLPVFPAQAEIQKVLLVNLSPHM